MRDIIKDLAEEISVSLEKTIRNAVDAQYDTIKDFFADELELEECVEKNCGCSVILSGSPTSPVADIEYCEYHGGSDNSELQMVLNRIAFDIWLVDPMQKFNPKYKQLFEAATNV
jgi:hypothetical protein